MRSLIDRWLASPPIDWALGATLALLVTQTSIGPPVPILRNLDLNQRLAIYQTFTGASAALLGFFIATVSILLTAMDSERPRMKKAMAGGNSEQIQSYFFAGIRVSSIALILLIVFTWIDNSDSINWVLETAVVGLVITAALATGRIIWVLRKVIQIAARDTEKAATES